MKKQRNKKWMYPLALFLCLALIMALFVGCSGGGESSAPSSAAAGESRISSSTPAERSGSPSSAESQNSSELPESSGQQTSSSPEASSSSQTGEPSLSPEDELVLYSCENMFPQEVLDGFTQETGVPVTHLYFDYDETMLQNLQTFEGGCYDVVAANDYILETVIKEGLAQKLNPEKFTCLKNVNPLFQGQFYDPQDAYTVPYGAGVQTIVYNPKAAGIEIKGYKDLWDPALKNRVGVVANPRVLGGAALKALGESFNSQEAKALENAGEKLKELAPNIRLIKDGGLQEELLSGEINAAMMYTSQAASVMAASEEEEGADLQMVFPEEGIGYGLQALFIPSAAPHGEAARLFIDYILRPEISAKCFEFLGCFSTNREADSLLSPEYREYLTLPEGIEKEDLELIRDVSSQTAEAYQKMWTAFKELCP